MKQYGIIMAGGGGTRFWPLSKESTPKQLLNLSGKEVMINEAIDRLAGVVGYGDIFVVTNVHQADKIFDITAGRIKREQIFSEPAARNTAACIGYAAIEVMRRGDGIMVITPSDAYIQNDKEFSLVLQKAISAAEETDALVTVGISPTFPSTGYGYLRYEAGSESVKKVLSFVEKPDYSTAERYLKDGTYLWNSGMFIWKASTILRYYKKLLPDIYEALMGIQAAFGSEKENEVLFEVYPKIRSVSIDYGIMEKADNIKVVIGNFGWNDVGSWDTLGFLHEADGRGNVTVGNALCVESNGNIVYSSGKLVSLVGVEDMIVVETPEAVMVCPKSRAQDVKKIVEELKSSTNKGKI